MGSEVLIAGYLSEDFSDAPGGDVFRPILATSTVGELYTFGSNYADVIDLSASPVGEQGASGGPVVRPDGSVIGLITTKGDAATGEDQSLRAISLSYIDRTITEETGYSLAHALEGDPAYKGGIFRQALVPTLSKLLIFKFE
jgi:S1-C subfamily serine protease